MRGMTPLLAARLQFYEFARMLHYKQASVHAQFDDHLRAFRKRCEADGMLAGWARVLYPTLFHASIASSAPVVAKLEMREYNDIAARALRRLVVLGRA